MLLIRSIEIAKFPLKGTIDLYSLGSLTSYMLLNNIVAPLYSIRAS